MILLSELRFDENRRLVEEPEEIVDRKNLEVVMQDEQLSTYAIETYGRAKPYLGNKK